MSVKRFTADYPCPVCGGHERLPRGEGVRCSGFLSEDGQWAHCSRDELAGSIKVSEASNTYGHVLEGDCRCGRRHGEYVTTPTSCTCPAFRFGSGKPCKHMGGRRIVETYDYVDAAGELLFQTVRYEPKDFRQRRPDGHGDWIWRTKDVRKVLYRLPDLLAADSAESVLFVEGEKDVNRAWHEGFVATTTPMGARKGKYCDLSPLQGRDVVIVADKDDDGLAHRDDLTRRLQGVAASVRVVELPEKAKKDLSDFFDAGGTGDELRDLIGQAWPEDAPVSAESPSGSAPYEAS